MSNSVQAALWSMGIYMGISMGGSLVAHWWEKRQRRIYRQRKLKEYQEAIAAQKQLDR